MNFLVPWLLAGGVLVAVPWLVHRIRRPQRQQLRFGSLMFVPAQTVEVIEPQRLQHLLLMALRMALLVALALAFSRPYWPLPGVAAVAPQESRQHVIAVDISASMGRTGYMRQARQQVEEILAQVGPQDRVGLVAFGQGGRMVLPLVGQGGAAAVRQAVAGLEPTWEGTRYGAGLRLAEQMLLTAGEDGLVHLVGDFQAAGLAVGTLWRLDSRLQIEPWEVVGDQGGNRALQSVAVQAAGPGRLQIRARVKNWSDDAVQGLAVRFVAGDEVFARQQIDLPPGNASLVQGSLDWEGGPLSGYVEIDADTWGVDDRRYFSWRAPAPLRLGVVGGKPADWSYERLVEAALPPLDGALWRLRHLAPGEVAAYLHSRPGAVIIDGWDGLPVQAVAALRDYWLEGGRLLVLLAGRSAAAATPLWGAAGPQYRGVVQMDAQGGDFARWDWVDLQHPVFRVFRAARFNDFSALHFRAYHRFQVDPNQEGVRVLARFEGAGDPAVMELGNGEGRLVVWSAGLDPGWSNMVRSARFVPLLQETLRYLMVRPEPATSFLVGEGVAGSAAVDRPGLYPVEEGDEPWQAAVNCDAAESDPARLPARELALRLGGLAPGASLQGGFGEGLPQRRETGRLVLLLALGLLALESYCAARRRRPVETEVAHGSA